jgi:alkylation response protein AidB-like acyl-CoA dehydrogenase
MDLNLTAEERAFRDELRAWLAGNVPEDWNERRFDPLEKRFDYLKAWQRKLYDGRWAAVAWPKQYGGRGASTMQQVIFWEEMARAGAPPLANVLGVGLVGPTLIAFGTQEQRDRYLSKILSAEEIWCQGFSEPEAGSDLAALRSEARLDGNHWVVNGHKVWNSYGWASHWCELVVRTDPAAPKHKGLTVLLVDMKSPGVEVRPLKQITGETEFSELFFRDVRVPVANTVGKVNDGWNVAIGTLMHERGTFGAGLQIMYRQNIDRLIALSNTMQRNGKPASQDPILRHKLAQCYAEVEIMRLNQMRAFSKINQTGVPGPEGSIQKIFWSELNQRMQQVAQELLGPYGQLEDPDPYAVDHGAWSYGYLRSRGNTIEAGTSEIQRNIIGHFVLGLPKSY